jgi:hypothetical protein
MGSVRSLCKTGVLLENGMVSYRGEINDVVDYYLSSSNFLRTATHVDIDDSMRDKNRSQDAILTMAEFVKEEAVFASDEDITIRVKVKSKRDIKDIRVNIGVMDTQDVHVGCYSSDAFFDIKSGEEKLLEYTLCNHNLAMGTYSLAFSVGTGNAQEGETNFDVVHHVLSFDIDRISCHESKHFMKWDKGWGNICFKASMKELR